MQKLAGENNLSETAFLVREGDIWHLRWFTPATEVGLCGHATLASAYVIMNCLCEKTDRVNLLTAHGKLIVTRSDNLYKMDFPLVSQCEIPVTQEMINAFGEKPVKALLGTDLVCVFENEEQMRALNPDQQLLEKLPGRGQHATAQGKDIDCVSRSFFPKIGIPEDPVCGSAHCQLIPYWCETLGKTALTAYQASRR